MAFVICFTRGLGCSLRKQTHTLLEASAQKDGKVMDFEPSELAETIEKNGEGASLISVLEEIQARYRYLPQAAMVLVSERLGVPLSQVYSVATFYNAFSLKPKGRHVVTVCMGTACHVRGSKRVLEQVEKTLDIRPGETTTDRQFSLETVNCLGACALGPIMVIEGEYFGQMTSSKVEPDLDKYSNGEDQGENT